MSDTDAPTPDAADEHAAIPGPAAGLAERVRQARAKFLAMATTYGLGVFNDNFFKQAAMLLAVGAGQTHLQGYSLVIYTLPFIVFAAPAGWLADRFAKRRVVIGSKALELAAMLAGAAGIITGTWWLIFTMLALMGLQSTLFSPALNGSIPELYPAEYVTRANAILRFFVTAAILAGVATAGLSLDLAGTGPGNFAMGRLAVGGVVVGVALIGLLISFGVPSRPAADPRVTFPWAGPLISIRNLRDAARDPLLGTTIAASVFIWFLGSLQILLINPMGLQQFGLGTAVTSYLIAAQLIGIGVGGFIAARVAKGPRWHRVIGPAGVLVAAFMFAVAAVPALPAGAQVAALFALVGGVGVAGGAFLIPVESFIQVRPPAARKGAVWAATNCGVFTGILLSGLVSNALLAVALPTAGFGLAAVATLLATAVLAAAYRRAEGRPTFLTRALTQLGRGLLRLRYRIRVEGLEAVAARGGGPILFLPNHPALIDPVIVMLELFPRFAPRSLADRDQVDRFLVRRLADRFGVRPMADPGRYGAAARDDVAAALAACAADLHAGRHLILYPAGRIYRSRHEDLGGTSALETLLGQAPDVRIVLVRTRGLWGSRFSRAPGRHPDMAAGMLHGLKVLLANLVLFAPRRPVTLELHEPADVPRAADRTVLNRYLETFYNADAPPNTYVPYYRWERGGVRVLPEPVPPRISGAVADAPAATRDIVLRHLQEASGVAAVEPGHLLARDLGLDSLAQVDLTVWLEREFGCAVEQADALRTAGDVILAACGQVVAAGPAELAPIAAGWFAGADGAERVAVPPAAHIGELFLAQARRTPGRVIVADQTSGAKTYRDLVTAVLVLRPVVAALPGEAVGIMLPASVGAVVLYLSALFAGKTPVMVNWTAGPRQMAHALELAGVQRVLTAGRLVQRLQAQGMDLSTIQDRLVLLEDVGRAIPLRAKLAAALRARLGRHGLDRVTPRDPAVILFTSGSESLPKAVPLTHANILTNARDVAANFGLYPDDRALGILPPFHSFGLTVTTLLPLLTGLRVVYHPNPTEGAVLARFIAAYGVTLLVGTPTFLRGIVRAADDAQLATLRAVISGAERCPDELFDEVGRRWPKLIIVEGYGITECSPVVAANNEHAPRRGAIGKPMRSVEHAVVDLDTNTRVPPGSGRAGMLLVRGPSVFGGYLGADVPSPFVEFEGRSWYRTGDLVTEDADGVLAFRGRLKRFAKLGGEMISLPAVEEALARALAPAADEPVLAVECTPVDTNPELVLFTTLDVDREAANRCIRDAGLSPLHNVRRVVRLEAIPLLGTGKTDYRALREMLRS